MKPVECNSKEDAVKMLQRAKEFFHMHVDMSIDPSGKLVVNRCSSEIHLRINKQRRL